MFVSKINNMTSNMGFKSVNHYINDVGETVKKFNYSYDNENEKCEVHIFRVKKLDNGNYKLVDGKPIDVIELSPEGTEVNLQRRTDLDKGETFAYQVVRKSKDGKEIWRGADTGVKMKENANGELVFRVNLDKMKYKNNPYYVYNADGNIKTGNDGKPVIKTFEYLTDNDFNDDTKKNYKYTLVTQNGTTPLVQGVGYLAMPDTLYPGMRYKRVDEEGTGELVYDKDYQKRMEKMVKTISNMYGGNIAGMEAMIPELHELGVKKFFTTPFANGDNRTSHGYYNKNNMQIPSNMGTEEDYDSLMKKEFQYGMNHVFDATLTSEGIEGIHVRYALRWGTQAQTYRWFRMSGLKDSGIGFGVVPNEAENLRHRVINAPYNYELQSDGTYKKVVNNNYKNNQPTLLQIYDGSQVTKDQLDKLDEPIDMYRELRAGRNLNITTYDDTAISYVFEINPNEYNKNVNNINELIKKEGKKIELNSPDGTIMASNMSNFHINKTSSGYVAWDDNPDMIKMNYGLSPYDEKEMQGIADRAERQHERELKSIAAKETTDLQIQSLKYRAEKTKYAHGVYLIQTLGNTKSYDSIEKLINEGKLPKEALLSKKAVENILNGEYNLEPKGILSKDDVTVKALMSLPLDALELNDMTVGVLSTSYFSNRATTDDTIGLTRFELLKQNNPHLLSQYENVYNKVNNMYTNELKDFAHEVIKKVNETSNEPLLEADGSYTEYGEYVMELMGRNISKYALLKSFAGDSFKFKMRSDGTIDYYYDDIKKVTSLKALGINASNPTEEAEQLQKKMMQGFKKLDKQDINNVAKAISATIKGTDTDTFRLKEAMIDKAGLELDYRLDAAKDAVDMDAVRNRESDFEDPWTNLMMFWKRCVHGIKSVNPHAYIVAEMTDIPDLLRDTYGNSTYTCPYNGWTDVNGAKYNGEPDAMTKFYNETGITSEAAYSYFFTELLTSFSRDFETGNNKCDSHDDFKMKYELLINTRSADYLRNLYTFVGNHDKTRSVHGLALDMTLFHSTLQHDYKDFNQNHTQRLEAIKVLSGTTDINEVPLELRLNVDNLDYFRTVSARAVAQSKLLMDSIENDLTGIASDEDKKLLKDALVDLTNGNYLTDKTTESTTRIKLKELSSIENAVKEVARLAENNGVKLSETEMQTIINNAKALNTEDYLVRGNYTWSEPQSVADTNKAYLHEIMGESGDINSHNLYTVQIARMIKNASKDSVHTEAINNALKDFVRIYNNDKISQNMDGYKMFENFATARKKNAYAAQDFRVALEEAFEQVEFKTGKKIKNQEEIIATVYQSITEPAVQKHIMMLSFLSAFCGIPTIFAGDEYGDTGYEDKAKNPNVKNRSTSRRSELEQMTKMGRIMDMYKKYTYAALQDKALVKALKDGTPYSMDVMVEGKNRDELLARISEIDEICRQLPADSKISRDLRKEQQELRMHQAKAAFMMQSADGDMAISVLNAAGIHHENRFNYYEHFGLKTKADVDRFMKENNVEPMKKVNADGKEEFSYNPYIPMQEKTYMDAILMGAGVTIPLGTIFVNSNKNDKTEYITKKIGNTIGIVRKDGQKIVLDGKTARNGVMVLKKLAFRGNHKIYNKQFNIPLNAYNDTKMIEKNSYFSVISK